MQIASTTCLQANKKLATHRSQVARCVARPLASTSSSRDEVTGGFAAAAHREPIAGSISSRLSFQLSRLLNVLLQPEPLHRSSFSSSSMLLCERVALPACVVSSLQVWHTLRILALLASASIIVALGRVSASHTAVHMPPARWFSRGAWSGHFAHILCIEKGIGYAARHPSLTCLAFPRSPVLLPPQNGSAATDCVVAHPRDHMLSGCQAA